jgi:hypothetical protein
MVAVRHELMILIQERSKLEASIKAVATFGVTDYARIDNEGKHRTMKEANEVIKARRTGTTLILQVQPSHLIVEP